MEILKTKDYGAFKFILSNREVDMNHVKKLAKSIQRNNLLYVRPIICDDKMNVIDGQHRLEAAKSISAEVYYMKVPNLTKADIAVLNCAQKNWTRADFINFYALEGNPNYKQLANLINEYYYASPTAIIKIATDGNSTDIRNGTMKLRDLKRARQVFDWVRKLQDRFEFATDTDFIIALSQVVNNQKAFDALHKSASSKSLKKGGSLSEYKDTIESHLK